MLVRALWSHARGYVIIRAKGKRLETFINSAIAADIHLWRLERAAPHLLIARIEAADFARLARTARRVGVHVTVLQKFGVPFLLLRARRRRAFVAGALLFIVSLYVLAQFVWFVRVEGTTDLAPEAVLAVASRAGLRPGVLRDDVKREEVVLMLHKQLPRVAWTAIELRGALATVQVVERTVADPLLHVPGHIVAEQDGIVERIAVTQGHAVVEIGDTVEAGQPLISGMLTPGGVPYEERLRAGQLPFIRAEGTVWGRVWYRGYAEVSLLTADMTAVAMEAARERAVAAAAAAVAERIPPGAEIKERDIAVADDLDLLPPVVRATVTVAVYQNLGRFSPVAADEPAGGVGQKGESDGQQD